MPKGLASFVLVTYCRVIGRHFYRPAGGYYKRQKFCRITTQYVAEQQSMTDPLSANPKHGRAGDIQSDRL